MTLCLPVLTNKIYMYIFYNIVLIPVNICIYFIKTNYVYCAYIVNMYCNIVYCVYISCNKMLYYNVYQTFLLPPKGASHYKCSQKIKTFRK